MLLLNGALWTQQIPAQAEPEARVQAGKAAFRYVLGQTTLSEAMNYWRASGAHVLRAGHLALGTGSGMDGVGKTSAEKVVLADIAGIDFEGITSARFAFYEQKLYRIQALLRPGLLNAKTDITYDDAQLTALEGRLRREYGPPGEQRRSLFVKKSDAPDVLSWKVDGNSLRFVSNPVNGSLILSNEETEASIRKYVKEYCKTVNTPGHIICW